MAFNDNEVLILQKRSGKSDDPYISISESKKIVNNIAILTEVADKTNHVTVSGNSITWIETTNPSPSVNQFYVDYDNGLVYHEPSQNGLTNTYSYFGKGYNIIGSSRVWTQQTGGVVQETLTEKLDSIDTKHTELDTTDASLQSQITTNDQGRRADLTAHENSNSAHSAANITFTGSGMSSTNAQAGIKEAWDRAGNIIAQSGTSSSEDVDARTLESGYTPNRTITLFGDVLRDMQSRLKVANSQSASIQNGLNYILSDTNSPLDVKVFGRSLVNLLGKDGNCEDTSKWTDFQGTHALDSTNKVYGSNSFKITISAGNIYCYILKTLTFTAGKYYIALADMKNGNASTGVRLDVDSFSSSVSTDTTKFNTLYVKVNPSVDSSWNVAAVVLGAETQYGYVDGIRLYEISAADYAAIDSMTADQIAAKYPYCDSVQHLENPILTASGKNQIPPFTEWTLHANAVVVEPYKYEITPTGTVQESSVTIPCLPSKAYTMQATFSGRLLVQTYDKNNVSVGEKISYVDQVDKSISDTFTTESNAAFITIKFHNNTDLTKKYMYYPQLELGSTATDFTPKNDSYLYGVADSNGDPIKLASNVDGSVRDEMYQQNGQWYKLSRFKVGVAL